MTEKLLPCPFCGGEAHITINRKTGSACVECDTIECRGWANGFNYNTESEAIAAWNTRAERECEILRNHRGEPYCTRCFVTLGEQMIDAGGGQWASPSCCPNCGAKVVEE